MTRLPGQPRVTYHGEGGDTRQGKAGVGRGGGDMGYLPSFVPPSGSFIKAARSYRFTQGT